MPASVERVSTLLAKKELKLTTAESCTGGVLAAHLTNRPGASAIFERGFITYSNESKTELLDVPAATLRQFGAISTQTAQAMAQGAITHSRADIALSITGIAGPEGGSPEKPVGLVIFGLATKEGTLKTFTHNFTGSRDDIRAAATQTAFDILIAELKDKA